ncbi:unnamed protein product [Closterium sp. Yama58-4]|nr:unnamed protein product [Closterium sp. Yama58-4]
MSSSLSVAHSLSSSQLAAASGDGPTARDYTNRTASAMSASPLRPRTPFRGQNTPSQISQSFDIPNSPSSPAIPPPTPDDAARRLAIRLLMGTKPSAECLSPSRTPRGGGGGRSESGGERAHCRSFSMKERRGGGDDWSARIAADIAGESPRGRVGARPPTAEGSWRLMSARGGMRGKSSTDLAEYARTRGDGAAEAAASGGEEDSADDSEMDEWGREGGMGAHGEGEDGEEDDEGEEEDEDDEEPETLWRRNSSSSTRLNSSAGGGGGGGGGGSGGDGGGGGDDWDGGERPKTAPASPGADAAVNGGSTFRSKSYQQSNLSHRQDLGGSNRHGGSSIMRLESDTSDDGGADMSERMDSSSTDAAGRRGGSNSSGSSSDGSPHSAAATTEEVWVLSKQVAVLQQQLADASAANCELLDRVEHKSQALAEAEARLKDMQQSLRGMEAAARDVEAKLRDARAEVHELREAQAERDAACAERDAMAAEMEAALSSWSRALEEAKDARDEVREAAEAAAAARQKLAEAEAENKRLWQVMDLLMAQQKARGGGGGVGRSNSAGIAGSVAGGFGGSRIARQQVQQRGAVRLGYGESSAAAAVVPDAMRVAGLEKGMFCAC